MKRIGHVGFLVMVGVGLAFPMVYPSEPAGHAARAAEPEAVRPELGKTLQAVQDLIRGRKFREALDRLRGADDVGGKSGYETEVIEQLRLAAAIGVGEVGLAAKSYELLAASGRSAPSDLTRYLQAITVGYYQAGTYAEAYRWGGRYLAAGGADPQVRLVVGQAAYLAGDYGAAVGTLGEPAWGGTLPPEGAFQVLAASYQKLGDKASLTLALERLVAAYPKPDYWNQLLPLVTSRPGFADRLGLDVGRLRRTVAGPVDAEQFVEQTQLALQAGLPGEAEAVITQGFSSGVLGNGAEADRHRRLKDLVARAVAEDRQSLPRIERDAAGARDGNALVATGAAYLSYGQADKAVSLIRDGIARGGLKYPEDARLHLALAQLKAGDRAGATATLREVHGEDGTADLARLWLLHLGRKA